VPLMVGDKGSLLWSVPIIVGNLSLCIPLKLAASSLRALGGTLAMLLIMEPFLNALGLFGSFSLATCSAASWVGCVRGTWQHCGVI